MKHKVYEDGILYNGDCLKVMPKLIQQGIKVDAIITDIPYGTTQCPWDTIIPFDIMWNNLNQLVKDNGVIALFGSEPFSSYLRISNIKHFKYDWIWEKSIPTGCMTAKYMPMKRHEVISIFNNKDKINFYPIMEKRSENTNRNENMKEKTYKSNSEQGSFIAIRKGSGITRNPTSVQYFPNVSRWKSLHPTQKPVALMEYLIKTYTKEGETVLDFTCGSGSTLVACRNTKRKFIGIELTEKYYKTCKFRLKHECLGNIF